MLIRDDEKGPILIGQPAHAWVSGQLARAWGNDRFGYFEPWEEVCLAAEQHDIGMAGWDAAPELNEATGLPCSFRELPRTTHLELWESAPSLVLSQSRYVSLLVSLHGTGLYEPTDQPNVSHGHDPDVRAYLARQRAFQDGLLTSLRADRRYARYVLPEVLARNRRLVARCDGISLALCHGLGFEHVHEGVPSGDGEVTITVTPASDDGTEYIFDPWPFAGEALTLLCEGRRLEGRFTDEEAMRAALARAPWLVLETRLLPA